MSNTGIKYDPSLIDGNQACSPACVNGGVCQNTICFCQSPYGGSYCETDLGIVTRVNFFILLLMIIGGFAIGFILVFIFKFTWDWLFYKELKPTKKDEDAWKP